MMIGTSASTFSDCVPLRDDVALDRKCKKKENAYLVIKATKGIERFSDSCETFLNIHVSVHASMWACK